MFQRRYGRWNAIVALLLLGSITVTGKGEFYGRFPSLLYLDGALCYHLYFLSIKRLEVSCMHTFTSLEQNQIFGGQTLQHFRDFMAQYGDVYHHLSTYSITGVNLLPTRGQSLLELRNSVKLWHSLMTIKEMQEDHRCSINV